MRDDEAVKAKVGRLLRVLVAGGVALAGLTGARAAEDPAKPDGQAPSEKADRAEKDKQPSHDGAQAKKHAGQEAPAEKKGAEKKADEQKADEGGGVKGW
jgi:hypothetical protein